MVFRGDGGDDNYSDIELGSTDARAYTIGLNYYASSFFRIATRYTRGEPNGEDALTGEEWRVRAQFTG